MICVGVANQKGGVGKTTTAINVATGLAAIGWRVLLVDLDPQGNASTGLGISQSERDSSSYDLLTGQADLSSCVVSTRVPRLDVIPATVDLSGAEIELVELDHRTHRLRNALEAAPSGRWDICLIDCPPSLGLLTINAMVAADQLLVPLQCEFFALEGLSQLLQTIERIRARAREPKEHKSWIGRAFSVHPFTWLIELYGWTLDKTLRHRFLSTAAILGLLVLTYFLPFQRVGMQAMPPLDMHMVNLDVEFDQNYDMKMADAVFDRIKESVQSQRDELGVKNVFSHYDVTGGTAFYALLTLAYSTAVLIARLAQGLGRGGPATPEAA